MKKSMFHYRKERHFAKPPEAIWPFIADTARTNDAAGSPIYRVEERPDAQGRIRRYATAAIGPLELKWQESFGEWQENRRATQTRDFVNGPMRHFHTTFELHPEGSGSRLVFSGEMECVGVLGWLGRVSGQFERSMDTRLAVMEKLIAEAEIPGHIPGVAARDTVKPAARRRLDGLIADLDRDPASHGLAAKLADYLLHAPDLALRGIRPLTMARYLAGNAGTHGRAVPRRATPRHSGNGLGSAMPALPWRQVAGRASARAA